MNIGWRWPIVVASIVRRDLALIAISWIKFQLYSMEWLMVEMDINLSTLSINQKSENVLLSMLEFQAYTWLSYLFYD